MTSVNKRTYLQVGFYAGLTAVFSVALYGWWQVSGQGLHIEGGRLLAIGRLFGIIATICILLEVFLMARTPFIEENFDLHDIITIHRLNGYAVLAAISGHISFLTVGYAKPFDTPLFSQFWDFVVHYEDVLLATIGTVLFFIATGLSVYLIRSRMRYELWYATHLSIYAAILFTFLHQIKIGADIIAQQWMLAYWFALYILALGLMAYYRFARQLLLHLRHSLYISEIRKESASVYSLTLSGRNIKNLTYKAGQYASIRILNKELWWESHPFSISSTPASSNLRFTISNEGGDFTKKLSSTAIGTKVLLDGPRGSFTAERATTSSVVLIAGGVGLAPYLSMLEQLLAKHKSVHLLYATRRKEDIAHIQELRAHNKNGLGVQLHISEIGNRISQDDLARIAASPSTTIFICGSERMSKPFAEKLHQLGVPRKRIITERFTM